MHGFLLNEFIRARLEDCGHPARLSTGFEPGDYRFGTRVAAGQDAQPQAGWKPAVQGWLHDLNVLVDRLPGLDLDRRESPLEDPRRTEAEERGPAILD